MRIALYQADALIGDCQGLADRLLAAAQQATAAGADLMVAPELAAIGYPPRDLLHRQRLVQQQWQAIQRLAEDVPLPVILGCVEPLEAGMTPGLANAAVVLDHGRVSASYHKRLLPTYDVFDEQRYFRPGEHPGVVTVAGKRIGLTVCEDIWSADLTGVRYHQDPVGDLDGACDLVVNISASPYQADKPARRRHLVSAVAARLGVPVVYVNQVGGQDELLFDGDSCVVAPDGRFLAQAPRWREDLVIADLDSPGTAPPADPEYLIDLQQGLVRGIRDYCGKTGQRRVVLGLSGGIDSAVVAALAVDALGADAVTGLLMPGPYSSEGSVSDADALAAHLGIQTFTCRIGTAFEAVQASLQEAFGDVPPNVAEENLQARLRGTLVMGYANKHNAMALTTGNKSEIAVGYCTIYGDMNGGLAPIGDVYKTDVYALAESMNRDGERIPVATITKPPSAELRPDQTDQDSLPPYDELDRILKAYLEHQRGPADQAAAGEDPAVVSRMVRLIEVNEYKRRQGAPILRVSPKAFGVGRRMPLARKLES